LAFQAGKAVSVTAVNEHCDYGRML